MRCCGVVAASVLMVPVIGRLSFGLLTVALARAALGDGELDPSFDPGSGPTPEVRMIAVQSDGRIVIGGSFSSYQGISRSSIARIHPDGALDSSFDPGTGANFQLYWVALQTDGKALIAGGFTRYNETPIIGFARLNPDGSLDTSFVKGAGANDQVRVVKVQSDGKIFIGGNFTRYNDLFRPFVARLNTDGTIDTSFDPGNGPTSTVYELAIQPDGKVLICGSFTNYNGVARSGIARINPDGSLDTGFDPGSGAEGPAQDPICINRECPGMVETVALQPDGKVLIGGRFKTVNGVNRNQIARLNADGSLDASFNAEVGQDPIPPFSPGSGFVETITVQPDGRILVGGEFTSTRSFIARLETNGILDLSFATRLGPHPALHAIVFQPDGRLLLGGVFTTVNDVPRKYIARIFSGLERAGTPSSLRALERAADGTFRLSLAGEAGSSYILEASSDFSAWAALSTNTLAGPAAELADPGAALVSQRFYRVRKQ